MPSSHFTNITLFVGIGSKDVLYSYSKKASDIVYTYIDNARLLSYDKMKRIEKLSQIKRKLTMTSNNICIYWK